MINHLDLDCISVNREYGSERINRKSLSLSINVTAKIKILLKVSRLVSISNCNSLPLQNFDRVSRIRVIHLKFFRLFHLLLIFKQNLLVNKIEKFHVSRYS